MKSSLIKITPEMAKDILSLNSDNRNINLSHVRLLADEMISGRWKENGEAIKVSNTKLLDGQHRLSACILSGVPFNTLYITELNDDVFFTLDTGKKRSAADALKIEGVKNPTLLAAAARQLRTYEKGSIKSKLSMSTGEIKETIARHPFLVERCNNFKPGQMKGLMNGGTLLAFDYIFSSLNETAADNFISSLTTGLNLSEGSAISTFRAFLFKNATSKRKAGRVSISAYLVKSFNAFSNERELKILRWNSDQPFPKISKGI